MKLVECVPNVSEGRDKSVLAELSKVVESVPAVSLLDVDPGADTNRTVFTFVGPPDAVCDAAFLFIERAAQLIDMRKHKGAHSRIGATDVTPFIPLSEMTMEECVALARRLGERVGEKLGIPVYLYEAAATSPLRKNLADIRKGEYEGLAQKLSDPAWKPDFGPATFGEPQQKSGASVIGARPFLVAYNVNLNTRDKKIANEIAFNIRESGRAKKDERGAFVLDDKGAKVMVPGTLKTVKATGWVIDTYGCAQVSMNLTDLSACGIAKAFEECERQAQLLGARVTGSELVGLIPKDELVCAGKHFVAKMKKPTFLPERELMEIAVRSMGLGEIAPFEIDKKVIEYRVAKPRRLASMSVAQFADQLSLDSPAPGGGSVSAVLGALAAGLGSMVAAITAQKKDYAGVLAEVSELGTKAQALKQKLVAAIDDDTDAFNAVLDAMRMPKDDPALREKAMEQANQGATLVPLEVMRLSLEALRLNAVLASIGFEQSQSDAGVGALAAMTALEGAYYNVRINLPTVTDEAFKKRVKQEAATLFSEAEGHAKKARAALDLLEGA